VNTAEVKAVVDANIKRLQWQTQTQAWTVVVDYEVPTGDPSWIAQVDRQLDYLHATISLDPERHGDDGQVLDSLRHELLHLLLAPFDLYADLTTQFFVHDPAARRVEQRAFRNAVETAVGNLERMLDHGHKPNPFEAAC
jgi:hypothetical protein